MFFWHVKSKKFSLVIRFTMSSKLVSAVKASYVKETYNELHKPETTLVHVIEALAVSKPSKYGDKTGPDHKVHAMLISSALRLSGQPVEGHPLPHSDDSPL
jgi:hypothetical protein